MITWETDNETVHALLVGYLTQRSDNDYRKIADVLKRGKCQVVLGGWGKAEQKARTVGADRPGYLRPDRVPSTR